MTCENFSLTESVTQHIFCFYLRLSGMVVTVVVIKDPLPSCCWTQQDVPENLNKKITFE